MNGNYDRMIKKLSWSCFKKLPLGYNELTLDDLIQEGNMELILLKRKRFKSGKAKFSTLLYRSLINRYQNILRKAYTKKRIDGHNTVDFDEVSYGLSISGTIIDENCNDQHLKLVRKEIIIKIRSIDEDIADLIENGVPDELLIYARQMARIKACKFDAPVKNISFTRKIIEKFYGIKIKRLIRSINSGF